MNKITHFTDLHTWKQSHILVLEIYRVTKKFPNDERFGLISQMRRAAVSITSNIAEGFGRTSEKEKAHFYSISRGSLMELESQLLISLDLEYIQESNFVILKELLNESGKALSGLIKYVSSG